MQKSSPRPTECPRYSMPATAALAPLFGDTAAYLYAARQYGPHSEAFLRLSGRSLRWWAALNLFNHGMVGEWTPDCGVPHEEWSEQNEVSAGLCAVADQERRKLLDLEPKTPADAAAILAAISDFREFDSEHTDELLSQHAASVEPFLAQLHAKPLPPQVAWELDRMCRLFRLDVPVPALAAE